MRKENRSNPAQADATPAAAGAQKEVILSWRVTLAAREGMGKLLLAVPVMAGMLSLGAYLYRDPMLVCTCAAFFFLATADYFLPIHMWLTGEGAYRRTLFGTRAIRWSDVKRCCLDGKGIKLSPMETPSAREVFKGLYLYFGDNRDELVDAVRKLASRE